MTGIVTTQFNSLPNGPSANGNAMASIEFDLVADEIVSIDVNNGAPGQGLSRIESLYVDNTRGGGYLFFVFNDVKRLLIVPPGAEGCYPTYSAASYFRVGQSQSKNGVHVRCKAFACTKFSFERFPGAGGLLQNPLDFNNTNGASTAAAAAPAQIIPPVTGWSKLFASPKVTFPVFNRVVTNNITAPTTIVWSTSHTAATAAGPRYFELTFEGIQTVDGIGLARHTEETTGAQISTNVLVVSNGIIVNVFPGSNYNSAYEYGVFQPNGSGAPADSVVGFVIDMLHGAMSVISANNYVAQASHHGLGSSYGINLADFNFAAFAYSPAIRLTGSGSSLSCTANTTGPFHYAAASAAYAPWDSSTNPPIYSNTPVTVATTAAPSTIATGSPYSFSYWRIAIHDNSYHIVTSLQELIFAAVAGGPSICKGGVPSSQSQQVNFPATNAFDNSPSFWLSSDNVPPDQWIQYSFGTMVSPVEVRLISRPDGYGNNECATSFDVLGSNDGINYTLVSKNVAAAWTTPSQVQAFAIPVHP